MKSMKLPKSLFRKFHNEMTTHVTNCSVDDLVATDRHMSMLSLYSTVKILKIGTPEIITIIVLQLEQLDFTVQYCVQKMQTE